MLYNGDYRIKETAPQELQLPKARTTEAFGGETMIERSLAYPAYPVDPDETRQRGTCYGCGTTTKTLTATHANVGHGYEGPM